MKSSTLKTVFRNIENWQRNGQEKTWKSKNFRIKFFVNISKRKKVKLYLRYPDSNHIMIYIVCNRIKGFLIKGDLKNLGLLRLGLVTVFKNYLIY